MNPKQRAGEVYRGEAWRAESDLMVRGKTAKDIVDFEAEELGNEDIRKQAESIPINLSAIPAKDVIWVTATKEAAEHYTAEGKIPVERIEIPKNAIILATDYEDGYLIWTNPTVKNVWQMTKQEFINMDEMDEGAIELLPLSPGKRERAVIHPSPKRPGYIQWSSLELNPITKLWEARSDIQFRDREELRKHLEKIHRLEIKQAIYEGKPVTREVLKDYPDLIQEHVR